MNLMGGHIWIESEGLDKGTTATFIIKLGNSSDPSTKQVAPKVGTIHGSVDLIGHKPVPRDEWKTSTNPRYQRSL